MLRGLADLGAVIVGKTKMCTFASAQDPTDQWITIIAHSTQDVICTSLLEAQPAAENILLDMNGLIFL